jgi:hypothetical protein
MPSSATITSFYNFSANTKARASQVNNNFDIFRGHIIPVHPSTATSANNTYDLGSSEYRWSNIYAVNHRFGTTTTSWNIVDSTTTNDYLNITQNGTSKFVIHKTPGATTTAAVGQFARSALIDDFASGSTATGTFTIAITGSTCTITTIGRPILCGIMSFDATTTGSFLQASEDLAGGNEFGGLVNILRDGSIISRYKVYFTDQTTTSNPIIRIPSSINVPDFPAAGTYNYSLSFTPDVRTAMRLVYSRTFAIEL